MFKKNIFLISLLAYFAVRFFSYFFGPPTPLFDGSWMNTVLAVCITITTIYLLIKKDWRGWIIVAGEIMICSSGNIFSVDSISLRTILLLSSLSIFFFQLIIQKNFKNTLFNFAGIPIFALLAWAVFSFAYGVKNNHEIGAIISDFIPYLFILYFYPLRELLKNKDFKTIALNILMASIFANAVFVFFTFIIFNLQITALHEPYYHWFRDIASGKITYLSDGFYRIVLNEHLLAVPLALLFLYNQIKNSKKINFLIIFSLAIILALSLTRIYYLALILTLPFIFEKFYLKKYFQYSILFLASIFLIFSSLYLFASRGTEIGWQYFGLRLSSIATPSIEDSSLSRMILLPEIIEKIKKSPVIGHGLGSSIVVYSPILDQEITTNHLDWGYFEIITEMGLIGLLIWFFIIGYLFLLFYRNKIITNPLPAMLLSILIINITSPAIFHVFGILLITIILACVFEESNCELIHGHEQLLFSKEE